MTECFYCDRQAKYICETILVDSSVLKMDRDPTEITPCERVCARGLCEKHYATRDGKTVCNVEMTDWQCTKCNEVFKMFLDDATELMHEKCDAQVIKVGNKNENFKH